MDIKRILTLMIFSILLISVTSALDFHIDNYKQFDHTASDYGKIKVYDRDIFSEDELLQEVTLMENTDTCLINCYAEGTTKLYIDSTLFDDYDFVDKKGKRKYLEYNVYIEKENHEEIVMPTYNPNCSIIDDETVCNRYQNGTYIKDIYTYDWQKYKGKELTAGEYKWRLEAKNDEMISIDWAVSFMGISTEEVREHWAWWNSNWLRKKQVTITESTGNDYDAYSVLLNISVEPTMNGVEDLRFLDGTESFELNHSVASNDSSNIYAWVKTKLNGGSTTDIYMYYDNTVATRTDNINNSFLFYDGASQDLTANYNILGTCTMSYVTNAYRLSGAGAGDCFAVVDNLNVSNVSVNINMRDENEFFVAGVGLRTASATTGYKVQKVNAQQRLRKDSGTDLHILDSSLGGGTYYQYNFTAFGSNLNNTVNNFKTTAIDTTYDQGYSGAYVFGSAGGYMEFSNLTIREYAYPEPTSVFGSEQTNTGISVIQSAPSNGFKTNQVQVDLSCNATSQEGTNISEISVYVYDGLDNLDYSNTDSSIPSGTKSYNKSWTTSSLTDDNYKWACYVLGDDATDDYAGNRTFQVHTVTPTVDVFEPSGLVTFIQNGEPLTLEWQVFEEGQNLSDHIANCSYTYAGVTTPVDVSTCVNTNQTVFNYSTGFNNLSFTVTDEFNLQVTNYTNWTVVIDSYTQGANYESVGEGTNVVFNLSVDYTIEHTSEATLFLDGNSYSPDNIITIANNNFYEKTVNIEDGFGNETGNSLNWYWVYNLTLDDDFIQTTNQTLVIYSVEIDDCSSFDELILNLTLLDEETQTTLPKVNESSSIELDLIISGADNSSITWQYSNTFENETNPQVCMPIDILNFSSYRIDFTIGLESTDRVKEFYYLDNGVLDLSKVFTTFNRESPFVTTDYNINLYDLLTTDSTTFLFNFFSKDGLPVDNAIIHTFRRYIGDGNFSEVERSKQDNNGETHIHVVEEDVIYYFLVSQNGQEVYRSEEYNALCQELPCTITLTETGDFVELPTDYSLINGSSIIITNQTSRTSTYVYQMSEPSPVEYVLYRNEYNGSVTEVDRASSTASSGTLTVTVPLHAGNQTYFTAVYKNDSFIQSQWVLLNDMDASAYLGTFLALLLGFLVILTLVLLGVTEKTGTILMFLLGLLFTTALGLTNLVTTTGQNLLIYVIIAGGIIIFKLAKKRS